MMKRLNASVTAVFSVAFVSCGGGGSTPSTPGPVATPTSVVVATPAPAPTPEPTPEAGEPPALDTKPVRITLRLFVVESPSGGVFQYRETSDGTPIIPVNYAFRLDIIAKDKKNKHTAGTGKVLWHWGDENIIEVISLANIFHPRLRATKAGPFCAKAELDGVFSNELCLDFRY